MELYPLKYVRDEIAKDLAGSSVDEAVRGMAMEAATAVVVKGFEDRSIALLNAVWLPVRANNYHAKAAIRELATNETGARLLFEMAELKWRTL